MKPLRQIAFLLEDFALQTPAQQLLDRFLVGYRRDGEFRRSEGLRAVAHLPAGESPELARRVAELGLVRAEQVAEAVGGADAIVIVPEYWATASRAGLVEQVLAAAAPGAVCFVHGALADTGAAARACVARARERGVVIFSGTVWPVTWRLPQVDLPAEAAVAEALIVVQGPTPLAGLGALEGLLPVLERRRGGEAGVRRVQYLEGAELWRAGDRGDWSWPLLAAALSRSDSPQGDTLVDGRTQDLVGLGLVPKLATHPRGWQLEHADGFRSTLLALDGVVADHNFAVRLRNGRTVSAQLFRAPVPAEESYSMLAATLETAFRAGQAPWPVQRNLFTAGLLEAMQRSAQRPGAWIATPELTRE